MINAMGDPNEIDNILPFRLGLRQAGVQQREGHKEKIIGTCNFKGWVNWIVQMVRNVEKDSFHLTKPIAREYMRSTLVEQAVPGKDFPTRAAQYAHLFMKLFVNTAIKVHPAERLKRDPAVVGRVPGVFADNYLRCNNKADLDDETDKLCGLRKDQCWD
ncbi:hypothetical protein HOY80DRAFT_152785 [Tuber brumale]|nr:hypothetical protein HOY80DRAFT_152785 [Tuber brumale]